MNKSASSCVPNFPEQIPFDCAVEIFQGVIGGEFDAGMVTKGLWVAGAIASKFGNAGEDDDEVTLASDDDKTVEELAVLLEPHFVGDVMAQRERPENIPPEVWMLLLELILKWIGNRQRRN